MLGNKIELLKDGYFRKKKKKTDRKTKTVNF